jgi:hypothetical protein
MIHIFVIACFELPDVGYLLLLVHDDALISRIMIYISIYESKTSLVGTPICTREPNLVYSHTRTALIMDLSLYK